MKVIDGHVYGDRIPHYFSGIINFTNGCTMWFKNGFLHREDGPAYINHATNERRWYWYNIYQTPMELFERLSPEKQEIAIWNLDQWK